MHKLPNSIDSVTHPTFALPADVDTTYRRGEVLANMGRYLEALIHFNRVLTQQPCHYDAWTFRGVMLIHLGRNQEALDSCNQALTIRPDDTEAWAFRGVALQRLRRYQAAYASYDKALGIDRPLHWTKRLRQYVGLRRLRLPWI